MSNGPSSSIGRRQLLMGAGGLVLAGSIPGKGFAAPRPFVACESGALQTLLVHPATLADLAGSGLLASGNPYWIEAAQETVAEHVAVVRALEATGARLLYLEDVLQSAIETARYEGAFDDWLAKAFPALAGRPNVAAAALLGQAPALHQLRDFAVMLPRGLALAGPSELLRFAARFARDLHDYPVLFDARDEGLHVEGRDIMVLDRRTLLVGVGHLTDREAAPILARRAGMDVIAIEIGHGEDQNPWRSLARLSDILAQVTPDHLVAPPRSLCLHVERFRAGSGDDDPSVSGMKLDDYLYGRDFRISYGNGVGDALVLTTTPGSVLAFGGASAALQRCGVGVTTVTGNACGARALALALERA